MPKMWEIFMSGTNKKLTKEEQIYASCEECGHYPMVLVNHGGDGVTYVSGVYKCLRCGHEVEEHRSLNYWT
jgi:uncharacterized Zn finger protein